MKSTFNVHTVSGRDYIITADIVKLIEENETNRLVYEFYGRKKKEERLNFIIADEVTAIFANEIYRR